MMLDGSPGFRRVMAGRAPAREVQAASAVA